MSKKLKNETVEPELCPVCSDHYTAVIRKKITCTFCHAGACSKCIEHYLLTRHEDAHCLHCRVNYNDASLLDICTRTYLSQTYFKHRQEVLINRERANLPLLQDAAMREKKQRDKQAHINAIQMEITAHKRDRQEILKQYNKAYVEYYHTGRTNNALMTEMTQCLDTSNEIRQLIREKQDLVYAIRWPDRVDEHEEKKEEEEKKKFIRRCTRDGCQGFLSTAWKCGICEWFSCSKCFQVKGNTHDVPHECKKEDVDTAELIKKDCKPCPKCGEFIEKSSGCDQMYCISCQTPWSWNTGKIVTSGPIHNPHYYEWLKRTGGAVPRNPADVPCGGFPGGWELVTFPRVKRDVSALFHEFHRICMELQEISTRQYRSHMDQAATNSININFLLGLHDEKKWGRLLAVQEKKRKRDAEIQEVLGAFRMVAVELINRVQNYQDGRIRGFTFLPVSVAEAYLADLNVQIRELVRMIADALRKISVAYSYAVPYINTTYGEKTYGENERIVYFQVMNKNFAGEVRQRRIPVEAPESDADTESVAESVAESVEEPLPALYHGGRTAIQDAAQDAAQDTAQDAAQDTAQDAAQDTAQDAVQDMTKEEYEQLQEVILASLQRTT